MNDQLLIIFIVGLPIVALFGLALLLWFAAKKRMKKNAVLFETWKKVGRHFKLEAEPGLGGNTLLQGKIDGLKVKVMARHGTPGGLSPGGFGTSKGSPTFTSLAAHFSTPLDVEFELDGKDEKEAPSFLSGNQGIDDTFSIRTSDPGRLSDLFAQGGSAALEHFLARGVRPLTTGEPSAASLIKKGSRAMIKVNIGDAQVLEDIHGRHWRLIASDKKIQIVVPGIINDGDVLKEAIDLILEVAGRFNSTRAVAG